MRQEDLIKAKAYQKFQRALKLANITFPRSEQEAIRHQYVEYYFHKQAYNINLLNEYKLFSAFYIELPKEAQLELE